MVSDVSLQKFFCQGEDLVDFLVLFLNEVVPKTLKLPCSCQVISRQLISALVSEDLVIKPLSKSKIRNL